MNRALWQKAVTDCWRQLLISAALLLSFSWLFAWLMSRFRTGAWAAVLNLLPNFVEPMIGVPLAKLATPVGQLSILYIHVVTLLICVAWALGRGSDSISGEIGRGTMDMILSLPIWRMTVIVIPAVVTAVGSALLAFSVWLGTALGVLCFTFETPVAVGLFLPGAVNLFCMVFCFTGMATLASSWGHDRWPAIAWAGGFYIISAIIKMVARLWPEAEWLEWLTFLTAFDPQALILLPQKGARLAMRYDLSLVTLGLLCYVVAAIIFARRDIPAPR